MKIFITGGTGNIGQYVTLAAAEAGHETVVLSRTPEKYKGLAELNGNIKLVGGLITDGLDKYLDGVDAVIHIALGWGDEPSTMLMNDTAATVALLEASEKCGVKKFIYTSSTAALGNAFDGISEDCPCLPTDLYGATKAASEAYVIGFRQYCNGGKNVNMKRNIIRPGYTFSDPPYEGGSTEPDGRFRNIVEAVRNNEPVKLIKHDGTQFVSAQELAKLYIALLDSDKNEEIYLGLGAEFISWQEIAEIAIKHYASKSEIILEDKGYSKKPNLYCVNKIKRDFGLTLGNREDLLRHIQ